jgi:C-terminal processing protease CtpA/Prc
MDKIIREFQDKDRIILDLRFSPGGYDEAALAIAGYFTDQKYLAYKKQTYNNGTFTELQSVYVNPEKEYYKGELIILTSGYTISAAEVLLRDIMANPNRKVTVIGEKTAGYYSDAIPKVLPGGIEFSMSVERYYWYDGAMLEGIGFEPQVEIPFDFKAVQEGKDPVLEYILKNK